MQPGRPTCPGHMARSENKSADRKYGTADRKYGQGIRPPAVLLRCVRVLRHPSLVPAIALPDVSFIQMAPHFLTQAVWAET